MPCLSLGTISFMKGLMPLKGSDVITAAEIPQQESEVTSPAVHQEELARCSGNIKQIDHAASTSNGPAYEQQGIV